MFGEVILQTARLQRATLSPLEISIGRWQMAEANSQRIRRETSGRSHKSAKTKEKLHGIRKALEAGSPRHVHLALRQRYVAMSDWEKAHWRRTE